MSDMIDIEAEARENLLAPLDDDARRIVEMLQPGMGLARAVQIVESPELLDEVLAVLEERARRPPADFREQTPIGVIVGAEVFGLSWWDDERCEVERYGARAELGGLALDVYLDGDIPRVYMPEVDTLGVAGAMLPLADIGRLLELGQAGHLDTLIRMARRWFAGK